MNTFAIKYSSRRTPCPRCEARHGWAAILEYGNRNVEGLGYGVCKACGFIFTPKHEHNSSSARIGSVKNVPNVSQKHSMRQFVEESVWQATLQYTKASNFAQYMTRIFGSDFREHLDIWGVGGDVWLATVWNYFDWQGRCCAVKTMPYNPKTGKRIKEGLSWRDGKTKEIITASAINGLRVDFCASDNCSRFAWFTKTKGYELCLYGEQWLTVKPEATVILVESEKTAVVGSFVIPDFVWIASGGTSGLTKEKARPLKGRTVLVCFDAEERAVERAQKNVEVLRSIGASAMAQLNGKAIIYHLLGEETANGKDIADELIEYFCQEQRDESNNNDENSKVALPDWIDRYEFEERLALMICDGTMSYLQAKTAVLNLLKKEHDNQ